MMSVARLLLLLSMLLLADGTCAVLWESTVNLQDNEKFWNFKFSHNKTYASTDTERRSFTIFRENLRTAEILTTLDKGTAVYGPTRFSDLPARHVRMAQLNNSFFEFFIEFDSVKQEEREVSFLPDAFDWRDHNAVTDVKDQGNCGSCWDFAAVENVESVWAVKTGVLTSLSTQQILDCEQNPIACICGWPSSALNYIAKAGLMSDDDYRYIAALTEKCLYNSSRLIASIESWTELPKDEQQIAVYMMRNGGVVVSLNALPLHHYQSGIIKLSHKDCNPKIHSHSVIIVGFGTENEIPFWIVKNSWGRNWGEDGYFRIYRGDNTCGIANEALSAVL